MDILKRPDFDKSRNGRILTDHENGYVPVGPEPLDGLGMGGDHVAYRRLADRQHAQIGDGEPVLLQPFPQTAQPAGQTVATSRRVRGQEGEGLESGDTGGEEAKQRVGMRRRRDARQEGQLAVPTRGRRGVRGGKG